MITLSLPDFVMILVIICFGAFGFAMGLIQVIGGLVGIFAGAWIASMFHVALGAKISEYVLGNQTTANTVAFILIFVLVSRLSGLIFYLVNRVFRILSFIPFLKSLNRFGGGLLGLLEGALLLAVILQYAAHYTPLPWVETLLKHSVVATWLRALVDLLAPLLPAVLQSSPIPLPLPFPLQIPTPSPNASPTVI